MKKSPLPKQAVKKLLKKIKGTSELFNEKTYEELYGAQHPQPTLNFSELFSDELSQNETTDIVKNDVAVSV